MAIHTVVFHRGHVPGRCVAVGEAFVFGTVHIQTALNLQAGNNLIAGRNRSVGTFFGIFATVHAGNPVGVVVTGREIGPLLHGTRQLGGTVGYPLSLVVVVAIDIGGPGTFAPIVLAIVVHVDVTRHAVQVVQGVHDRTTTGTVLGIGVYIVQRQVYIQFLVEQRVVLTEREGITLIRVVGYHTIGIGVGIREIGTNLLGTTAYRNRVVVGSTRLEEIGDIVLGIITQMSARVGELVGRHIRHLLTPARGRELIGSHVDIGTVGVLDLGENQRSLESYIGVHAHRDTTLFTAFGGNHQHTVGSSTTVKGGGIGTFQNVDAFDVVGVDERKGIATLGRARIGKRVTIAAPCRSGTTDLVGHRNTVDHNQRAVVTHNRLVTTQQDFRGTTGTTGTLCNRYTGSLTLQ